MKKIKFRLAPTIYNPEGREVEGYKYNDKYALYFARAGRWLVVHIGSGTKCAEVSKRVQAERFVILSDKNGLLDVYDRIYKSKSDISKAFTLQEKQDIKTLQTETKTDAERA